MRRPILFRWAAVGDADVSTKGCEPIAAFVAEHPLTVGVYVQMTVPAAPVGLAECADACVVNWRQSTENAAVAASTHPAYHRAAATHAVRHPCRSLPSDHPLVRPRDPLLFAR